jgi:hypothetical protein
MRRTLLVIADLRLTAERRIEGRQVLEDFSNSAMLPRATRVHCDVGTLASHNLTCLLGRAKPRCCPALDKSMEQLHEGTDGSYLGPWKPLLRWQLLDGSCPRPFKAPILGPWLRERSDGGGGGRSHPSPTCLSRRPAASQEAGRKLGPTGPRPLWSSLFDPFGPCPLTALILIGC